MGIGGGKGDVHAAAVRIMRRAQWFLISLPIARNRVLSEGGSRFEHCPWWEGGVVDGSIIVVIGDLNGS